MMARTRKKSENKRTRKSETSCSKKECAVLKRVKIRNDTECEEINWTIKSEDARKSLASLNPSDPVLRLNLPPKKILCNRPPIPRLSVKETQIEKSDVMDNNSDQENGSRCDNSFLSKLLYPLPPSIFLSECFRKIAVHVSSNDTERACEISNEYMFGLDTRQIFEETSSDNIFLWLVNNNDCSHKNESKSGHASNPEPMRSVEISDPEIAHALHIAGNHATYCRAPPELEQPLVSKMLHDTGLGCGQYDPSGESTTTMARGEVEVFVGTKGHITNWHTDFQENFTIQLSGTKKWSLRQGSQIHPLRGITPHYSSPNTVESQLKAARLSNSKITFGHHDASPYNARGDTADIIMKPGDTLYFPAGMWHRVETLESGISINISLMGSTYASLICGALQHLLLKEDRWREVISNGGLSYKDKDFESEKNKVNICPQRGLIDKLNHLLSELPDLVHKFVKNGAAENILPPVLRYPPKFQIDIPSCGFTEDLDSLDSDGSSNNNDVAGNDSSSKKVGNDVTDGKEIISLEDENSTKMGLSLDDSVIDIDEFKCPWSSYTCERPGKDYELVKNPLAMLTRMSDVTSFYDASLNKKCESDKIDRSVYHSQNKNLYALNVSFAGNEMHESMIRVVFRDTTEFNILEECCKCEETGDETIPTIFNETKDEIYVVDPPLCLFYYGYYHWIKKA